MTAAEYNFFFRVDFTLATYSGGAASTMTVSCVNKPLKASSSVATYWPILESVGEVNFQAGEFLPNVTVGSITLNNTIGSFGANRKFSDLLQRYTPVEQDVTVYVGASTNDSDTVSSWTQVAVVKCSSWEHAANGGTLTLNFNPFRIDEKVLTVEVERSLTGMTNAPDSSLGRAIPLVLGEDRWVVPVRISADGATQAAYAYASGLYNHFNPITVSTAAVLNYNDEWEETTFSGSSMQPDHSAETITGQYTLNTYAGRAFKLDVTDCSVAVGIQLRAKGNGSPSTSTAYLTVQLLRVDSTTYAVVEEMATGRVDLRNYDSPNNLGTANFAVNVSFDRPAVLSAASAQYDYYVAWSVTGFTADDLSLNYEATTVKQLVKDNTVTATNSYAEWQVAANGNRPLYKFLEVLGFITGGAGPTQTGLGFSRFTIYQPAPDSGQASPPLESIQFLLKVDGLGSGSTWTAAHSVLDRLGYTWNGSSWVDGGTWDVVEFGSLCQRLLGQNSTAPTDTVRGRTLKAVYDQRVTFSQVVTDVCRGLACRVGVLPTGKLFLYPWGEVSTDAAIIPASDIIPLSWQQRDVSTVINRAVIVSDRSPYYSLDTGNEKIPEGYGSSTDFSATSSAYLAQITAQSRAMYGEKELANGTLNAFGTDSVLAEYYFTRFGKPAVYASFIVPWHRYSELRMFDTVSFQHPEFPAYYGTDPSPDNPVVDDGSTVTRVEPNQGYEWVRAEPYRGLIEGISYVMAMEHAPMMRLTVLVLLNSPYDPT